MVGEHGGGPQICIFYHPGVSGSSLQLSQPFISMKSRLGTQAWRNSLTCPTPMHAGLFIVYRRLKHHYYLTAQNRKAYEQPLERTVDKTRPYHRAVRASSYLKSSKLSKSEGVFSPLTELRIRQSHPPATQEQQKGTGGRLKAQLKSKWDLKAGHLFCPHLSGV